MQLQLQLVTHIVRRTVVQMNNLVEPKKLKIFFVQFNFPFFFTITVNFSIFSIFAITCSLDCSASPLCVGCFESCRRRRRLESTCNDLQ